uniref:Uncharacterized protein n=1 Tax=Arundo donax TaxID=35708 RepID=A0A0A9HH77_ARUDO
MITSPSFPHFTCFFPQIIPTSWSEKSGFTINRCEYKRLICSLIHQKCNDNYYASWTKT